MVVALAAVIDIRCRRIPNWLTVPFLAAGVVFSAASQGWPGFGKSLEGVALAAAVLGVFCWLQAMGMGDLKLCAAVGAWVGGAQLGMALLFTALAGGAMATMWAVCHGAMEESLAGASELVLGLAERGLRPHPSLTLGNPRARTMPYAPAIAVGTLLSFFC